MKTPQEVILEFSEEQLKAAAGELVDHISTGEELPRGGMMDQIRQALATEGYMSHVRHSLSEAMVKDYALKVFSGKNSRSGQGR